MKNLLMTRFLNFGLPQKLNDMFAHELENFDMAKLDKVMALEKPEDYLVPLKDNFLNLVFVLADMDRAMENFHKLNVPDEIALNSLDDAKVWVMNLYNATGEIGLMAIDWECYIHRAEIFKIGRLQFQPKQSGEESAAHGLKKGDNILNMHIQEGPGLTPEACAQSIKAAKEFFAKYFPDFKYTHMVCGSWLLDPALREMLKPDSNILRFADMFEIVKVVPGNQGRERVFRQYADLPNDRLPEETTLQKNMKAFLLKGGTLSSGFGILKQ